MKRRSGIPKELETSEVSLARLLQKRSLLEAKITQLEERRAAGALQFILDTAERLNLAQLPAARILAAFEQLADGARVDRPMSAPAVASGDASDDPRQEFVEAFVKLTRNTTPDNREILGRAGVRWNGRSGGWSGRVTMEAMQRLRDAFPGRVVGPDLESSADQPEDRAGPAVEAEGPSITSPDTPTANVEAEVAQAEDRTSAETAAGETVAPTEPAVSAASRLLRPAYRSPVPRRPSPT